MSNQVSDAKAKLLDKDNERPEILVTDGKLYDPCNSKEITLNSDYYTLCWVCLKKDLFKNKKINSVDISLLPKDYFQLYFEFLFFIILILVSLLLVMREAIVDDVYVEGSLDIIIFRVILMYFAIISLSPEFKDGYAKYLYTLKHDSEFTYAGFARFVGFCQILNAAVTTVAILFYVCTADEFAELLTNFSGLAVLAELDDWIGEMILYNHIDNVQLPEGDDEKSKAKRDVLLKRWASYDIDGLNERMSILEKMSLINADTDLAVSFNERITEQAHWTIYYFDKVNKFIPWEFIFGVATIPMSYYMPIITQKFRSR